jgi:hypothetical protein
VLIVLFAVIGFLTTLFIVYDYIQASLPGRGVRMGSFPHIFRPNIPINRGPAPQIDPSTGQIRPTPLEELALLYPINPEKTELLLGASHNVFIGKVLARTGNKETEIGPRTQYQVQVIGSIKGELVETITIDMLGGYNKDGKLVIVESGDVAPEDALFQPGSTYLFAARYNAEEDWYTVIAHPNARKVLSTDNSLPTQALRALADQDEKFKTFKAAYPDEQLLEADVANNNTRNSFQSLPPEAKAAALARADAARASLGVGAE